MILLGAIFTGGLGFAQSQQDPGNTAVVPVAAVAPEPKQEANAAEGEESKRILGVLPNYRTADGTKDFVKMTPAGKMRIALKDSFDYPNFAVAAALAGIYHLEDQNPSFGQGAKGYAHRYITGVADQVIGNMLTEGLMPVLLKEDPRYFRKVNGSFRSRLGYSVTRVFIAKNDNGATCINFAEIGGNGISAAIGNLYYPDNRGFSDTMTRMGTAIATDAISNVLKEFWPDIKKRMHHNRDAAAAATSVAP